jgi:hypothetical protein
VSALTVAQRQALTDLESSGWPPLTVAVWHGDDSIEADWPEGIVRITADGAWCVIG